ncbi:ABC transporter [Nitritalea halalkaliphila LW7]|uniref:ABC transporter n=2 Tax=Nitritalea TaxID=1187887 RepID=I5C5I3_9BACT|nr:ABC transporter ATP-binding protein [Nitritalea halalkaliphila]EIM77085.1 ABC transporter [Nitritalea halalkaliphila LW7]
MPAHERQIGMVFQDYALFPHLTLLENVCYGLKGSRKDQETVAMNTLRLVGLQESVKKYPHQLSGGQQQRVALARAIAPNPKILLMDEPFSNLDAVLKDQVREEIRLIIKKTGITAIFVTHDTRDALSTADRIAILHEGRLQQVDVPRTLYEQPANAYVANFFGKQNAILASATTEGFYTDFGYIPDPRAGEYRTKVQILFRPEHAQLLPEAKKTDDPSHPLLFGRLYKVNYYGDHQIVKLSDEFGKRISIRVAADMVLPESGLLAFRLLQYATAEAV